MAPIPPELGARIMRLYSEGVPKSVIARSVDRRFSTVSAVIARGGTVRPPSPDAAIRAAILAGGTNPHAIAKAHGCHKCVVKRVMAEMQREGLIIPPKGDKYSDRTKQIAAAIARMKADGKGRSEIMAALKISRGAYRNAIEYALKHPNGNVSRAALLAPNRARPKPKTDTAKAQVIEMLRNGSTVAQVVAALKVGDRWVRKIRKLIGIRTPPNPDLWRYRPAAPGTRFETVEEFLARGGIITKCPTPYMPGAVTAPRVASVPYIDEHPYMTKHRGNHFKRLQHMAAMKIRGG